MVKKQYFAKWRAKNRKTYNSYHKAYQTLKRKAVSKLIENHKEEFEQIMFKAAMELKNG